MSHTKAPWSVEKMTDEDETNLFGGYMNAYRIIGANLVSPGIVFGGDGEFEANRALIAAAPDLLAACERLETDDGPETWAMLRAAVARASRAP